MSKPSPQEILEKNLEELRYLVFQANEFNSKEACGKIYFCLEMINKILKQK